MPGKRPIQTQAPHSPQVFVSSSFFCCKELMALQGYQRYRYEWEAFFSWWPGGVRFVFFGETPTFWLASTQKKHVAAYAFRRQELNMVHVLYLFHQKLFQIRLAIIQKEPGPPVSRPVPAPGWKSEKKTWCCAQRDIACSHHAGRPRSRWGMAVRCGFFATGFLTDMGEPCPFLFLVREGVGERGPIFTHTHT